MLASKIFYYIIHKKNIHKNKNIIDNNLIYLNLKKHMKFTTITALVGAASANQILGHGSRV